MERRDFLKTMGVATGAGVLAGCGGPNFNHSGNTVPIRKYASCGAINCDAGYEVAVFKTDEGYWEVGAAAVKNDEEGTLFYRQYDEDQQRLEGGYDLFEVEENAAEPYEIEAVPAPFHVDVYDTGIEDDVATGTIELQLAEPTEWARRNVF